MASTFMGWLLLLTTSVALSIHILLTFHKLYGTGLTLGLIGFWVAGAMAFINWKESQQTDIAPRRAQLNLYKSKADAITKTQRRSA